jgi:hypothetical protein
MADSEQAPETPPRAVPANPFPGLRPFKVTESDLFFGRKREVRELLSRLQRNRFLAVVGTSGCGKSSLIQAGLLAALRDGFLATGGAGWRIASLRPGDAPLLRLAEALDQPGALRDLHAHPEEVGAVLATLRRGSLGLVETAAEARLPVGELLLVLVDQFEELFRFAAGIPSGGEEARAFSKLLTASVSQREVPIYVVLTMRSDFLGHCASLPGLPEAINQSLYLVPQMGRDALREVVKEPVKRAGAKITERLVNRLLNDLGSDPDQLPILQHALMRIWDIWSAGPRDGPLDLLLYQANGLEQHLEEVYGELQPGQQRVAERLFRELTETLDEGRVVRRPTRLERIVKVAGSELVEVEAVVERFRAPGRSFLMPPVGVPLTPETVLDISHESLIRQWPRLTGWAAAEAGTVQWMQMHALLGLRATQWRQRLEDRSLLLSGQLLAEAEEWLARGPHRGRPVVTSEQTRYILASRQAVSRKQRRTLFATMAMLLVMLALSIFALWQRDQAFVSQEQSRNRTRAAIAANLLGTHPT